MFAAAVAESGADPDSVALVAFGGYGRAEMCPQSDLDVMLLHRGGGEVADLAERLWYPVWDAGLKLGHAVRTPKEALKLASDDLETATSLLTVRHLAGAPDLTAHVADGAAHQWRRRAKRWLGALAESVEQRWAQRGEVAFLLEPDLKEGRGGLRDLQALGWAEAARGVLLPADAGALGGAHEVLLASRVALGRVTGRPSDVLLLQEQDAVATALGQPSADELMRKVAEAARAVAWTADDTWDRIRSSLSGPFGRTARRDRTVAPGVVLRDGRATLARSVDVEADPVSVLRLAAAAAHAGARIDRHTVERLDRARIDLGDPWPDDARHELVSLLGAGPAAVSMIETLDHVGVMVALLPEWAAVRSKPQRNAYHRFTVDRHLCEAAANAAALTRDVARPDLLLVGAWLHDIGKGFPGDHTEVGMEVVDRITRRMGFSDDDVAVLVSMVEHHLLLPDVATRRDLDDDATITGVADAVGSSEVLELLVALTEADSLATGPSAWSRWKAGLVSQLARRVEHVVGGGEASEVTDDGTLSPEMEAVVAAGPPDEPVIAVDGRRVSVAAADRPGIFSRVAGTLALHGLDVLGATASSDGGVAVASFDVEPLHDQPDWSTVIDDIGRALSGRMSIDARLAARAQSYAGLGRSEVAPARPRVLFDNHTTPAATVVEVRAPDAVGVLYRITRAFAELDLDIRSAKVQTLGHDVVDSFYVLDAGGSKIDDVDHQVELERAVLHHLSVG